MSQHSYRPLQHERNHSRNSSTRSSVNHSRPASSSRTSTDDSATTQRDRDLSHTFETLSDDENVEDDRQRLMHILRPSPRFSSVPEQTTSLAQLQTPSSAPDLRSSRAITHSSDGVFANLSAKQDTNEKIEDLPPSYEVAAADATPPYWETTLTAPGFVSDEIYVDGLPVGTFFSFLWNGLIAMTLHFFIGFILTYLLHTTHAAKNGSRAGLGISLVQWGFLLRAEANNDPSKPPSSGQDLMDPSSHDFDPSSLDSSSDEIDSHITPTHFASRQIFAYILLVGGWIILIKAIADYYKARRHEKLILLNSDRSQVQNQANTGTVPEGLV